MAHENFMNPTAKNSGSKLPGFSEVGGSYPEVSQKSKDGVSSAIIGPDQSKIPAGYQEVPMKHAGTVNPAIKKLAAEKINGSY